MNSLLLSLALLNGGDAITTHVALNHGAHEVVLSGNPWATDAIVGGATVGQVMALRRLHETHPKLAIGLAVVSISVRGAVVASNVRQLRRQGLF